MSAPIQSGQRRPELSTLKREVSTGLILSVVARGHSRSSGDESAGSPLMKFCLYLHDHYPRSSEIPARNRSVLISKLDQMSPTSRDILAGGIATGRKMSSGENDVGVALPALLQRELRPAKKTLWASLRSKIGLSGISTGLDDILILGGKPTTTYKYVSAATGEPRLNSTY